MNNRLILIGLLAVTCSLTACSSDDPEDLGDVYCGNAIVNWGVGETCDGANLGDQTCADVAGFTHGTLACNDDCTLDSSGCLTDPCWSYACDPYGYDIGDVARNEAFWTGGLASEWLADPDDLTRFYFRDLWARNVAHGGDLKGVLLYVSTGWCPYCHDEALQLPYLWESVKQQGIMIVGVMVQDEQGRDATGAYASSYADAHGWTFPTVAGPFSAAYWTQDGDEGAVPFHMYLDMETMQIYGRFTGASDLKTVRIALDELALGAMWDTDGVTRSPNFDCAPGTGNEIEPNDMDNPEPVTTLPHTLTGVICAPTIIEGLQVDQDVLDLGTLTAGTYLDVVASAGVGSDIYPNFTLMRLNEAGTSLDFYAYAPSKMSTDEVGRQYYIDTEGQYLLAVGDGRRLAGYHYNVGDAGMDACCNGGPDSTYEVTVGTTTLAATETALVKDTPVLHRIDPRNLKVYPFDGTSGELYSFRMAASDATRLDPYLTLVDAASGDVLDFNDDIGGSGDDYNSNARIMWTAPADMTVWLVAGYWGAFFDDSTGPRYEMLVY